MGQIHTHLSSVQISWQDSSKSAILDQAASYTQHVFTPFQFVNTQQFSTKV